MSACQEPSDKPCRCVSPQKPTPPKKPSGARQGWQRLASFELEDLADLYGIDPDRVRLR